MFNIFDYIEPTKDCQLCDYETDYVCFDCEKEQIKQIYPHAKTTYQGLWDLETDYIPMV